MLQEKEPEKYKDRTVENVKITRYYGKLYGAEIADFKVTTDSDADSSIISTPVEKIGDVLSCHVRAPGNTFWVNAYYNGAFYTLSEAYEAGIFTHDELLKIRDVNELGAYWQSPYQDVAASAWYHRAVYITTKKKCMQCVGDGLFAPEQPMTRAMLITVLWRLCGATLRPAKFLTRAELAALIPQILTMRGQIW